MLKADEKKCPRCAEAVKADAKVCKHCGYEFSEAELAAAERKKSRSQLGSGIGCLALILLLGFCTLGGGESAKDIAKREASAAADKVKGFHCLSSWDGSNRDVVSQVKAQLRDPDSFEHIETKITPSEDGKDHLLMMKYRARNGFGGMNVGEAMARIDHASCEAEMISVGGDE